MRHDRGESTRGIRMIVSSPDTAARTYSFAKAASYLAQAKGHAPDAAVLAQRSGASLNEIRLVRSAVPAGATSSSDYDTIAGLQEVSAEFVALLANTSAFFALMAAGMTEVPFQGRIGWTTAGATAFIVGEGAAVPATSFTLDGESGLPRRMAAALIVLSDELASSGSAKSEALIAKELRRAVAKVTDEEFFDLVVGADTTQIASAGTDADDAVSDLRALLEAVAPSAQSKLLWAFAPDAARRASMLATMAGSFLFPNMSPSGGSIRGIPAIVTDGLAAGKVALLDGASMVGALEPFGLLVSTEATVEMQTEPTQNSAAGTGASLVSLWQSDLTGIFARAPFGVKRIRNNAVALLNGVAWGGAIAAS
jgi:HK97 family phage major capsid protein